MSQGFRFADLFDTNFPTNTHCGTFYKYYGWKDWLNVDTHVGCSKVVILTQNDRTTESIVRFL